MSNNKKQNLKRLMCLYLSVSSIVISSEVCARKTNPKGDTDHPVRGGSIPVPRKEEALGKELEGSNFMGQQSKVFKFSEDTTQRDLKSPPTGSESYGNLRSRSRNLRNEMIDKYEKKIPQLARFRDSKRSNPSTTLLAEAEQFYLHAESLRQKEEEFDREVSTFGKDLISLADRVVETGIEKKVKDTQIKSKFISLKNFVKKKLTSFFE